MAKTWDKINIKDRSGVPQTATAPVIISASRSTDLPKYYSEWFFNRLKEGYCIWTNPFNGVRQYVSFKKARFFVFWSKDPSPMIDKLNILDERGVGYYFQFTMNDYDGERYEPNVPALAHRIDTFKRLSDRLGPQRVIWRFDPLILSEQLSVEILAERINNIMTEIKGYTERFVFSFLDLECYKKVQSNLGREKIILREFTESEMGRMAMSISKISQASGIAKVATCGEKVDLSLYGVEHSRCIDDELIVRCSPKDKVLLDFLGWEATQPDLFSTAELRRVKDYTLKDKGQRAACGCIVSKDIGMYNTCMHECIYCYANATQKIVEQNYNSHDPMGEGLVCAV